MNAPIAFTAYTSEQVAEFVQPAPREIPRLIELHAAIERMRDTQFEILPDNACDRLYDATTEITQAIVTAPITCSADVADKFRFAASFIENDEGGVLNIEAAVVIGALRDLISLRDDLMNRIGLGSRDPAYSRISIA